MFLEVHPVLPCRDAASAIEFYVGKLGFMLVFRDGNKPTYGVVRRDAVEIHLQRHDPDEWERVERPMLRFLVADPDALHDEFKDKGVFHDGTALRDTPWDTREFAFYDPDQNGLTFYRPV